MTATFILSKKKLLKQFEQAKQCADVVSYSFKTNPEVGEVLEQQTECDFSVHSYKLLERIKEKSRVWFFAQGWTAEQITQLLEQGVRRFVVDNQQDLNLLINTINTDIDLLLRMRLKENTIHTGKHFVFGMRADEVNELIPTLRKNKHIKRLGLHTHRKTQNISEWSLQSEFEQALNEQTLKQLDVVNIGGGIPVSYKNSRANYDYLFKQLEKAKVWLNGHNIKMAVEPGRFLAAPCINLQTTIIAINEDTIVIDASIYNAAMDTFIANVRLEVEGEQEKGTPYTIKGCTPDSVDIFRYRVYLEKTPKVGDAIIFKNAGAYNFATEFCGLEKLPTSIN